MGLADFDFSMKMRDVVDRLVRETIDTVRPRYRYAVVESIDWAANKCSIVFNGETGSVIVNMGTTRPSAVGQVVRIEGIGTDKFVTEVIGGKTQAEDAEDLRGLTTLFGNYARQMQVALTGGGFKEVDSLRRISWSTRFLAISAGERGFWMPSGYFQIEMPPDGTVIPNISTGGSVTVGASLPGKIQLPTYGALWYIPPWGAARDSVPANFRIVDYTTSGWSVGSDWILVCVLNNDAGQPASKWGTGELVDYWRAASLANGWTNYNTTTHLPAQYKKLSNGQVEIQGLVANGTSGAVFTLPVGYRPLGEILVPTVTSTVTLARLNIQPSGAVVLANYNVAWCSIAYTFTPGA